MAASDCSASLHDVIGTRPRGDDARHGRDLICPAMELPPRRLETLLLAGDPAGARAGLEALGLRVERALVIATAAAYIGAEQATVHAHEALAGFASDIDDAALVHRRDLDGFVFDGHADLVYFTQGSGLHLMSVLRGSNLLEQLHPRIVVAVGESAMATTDPMVDPRGGAPTIGLGLEQEFCVLTGDAALPQAALRTKALLGREHALVALDAGSWLLCDATSLVGRDCRWVGDPPAGFEVS